MPPLPPVATAPLIPDLNAALIALLRDLSPAEWDRPATPRWRVRDVAAHLLDGDIRRLSAGRVLLHALPPDRARGRLTVEGDAALAEPFLTHAP